MKRKIERNDSPCIMYEDQVNREEIFDRLFVDMQPIIYVISRGRELVGGITAGDVLKYLDRSEKKWVNKALGRACGKDEAVEFIIDKPNVHNIPIVDDSQKLLYEYKCVREDIKECAQVNMDFMNKNRFRKYLDFLRIHLITPREYLHKANVLDNSFLLVFTRKQQEYFTVLKRHLGEIEIIYSEDLYNIYQEYSFETVVLQSCKKKGMKDIYAKYFELFGDLFTSFYYRNLVVNLLGELSVDYDMVEFLDEQIFARFLANFFRYSHTDEIIVQNREVYQFLKKWCTFPVYYGNEHKCNGRAIYINDFASHVESEYYERNKEGARIDIYSMGDLVLTYLYMRASELLLKKLERRDVKICVFTGDDSAYRLIPSVEVEKRRKYALEVIRRNPVKYYDFLLEQFEDKDWDYIQGVMRIPDVCEYPRKERHHREYHSQYINVEDGDRVVRDVPQNYDYTIHCFGNCYWFGYATEDRRTIPNLLQQKFNQIGHKIRIMDHSIWGSSQRDFYYRLANASQIREGDIVLCALWYNQPMCDIDVCDLSDIVIEESKKASFSFWEIPTHSPYLFERKIFPKVFSEVEKVLVNKGKSVQDRVRLSNRYLDHYDRIKNQVTLNHYLEELGGYIRDIPFNGRYVGSIVMNANPFTKGHRYLVEYAAKKVDFLLVFVVEEDASYFSFKDRFEMVSAGVQDMKNVLVVPSGEMIISQKTFSGYFAKECREEMVTKDFSLEADLFIRYICPTFNIKIRFFGEEPKDELTRNYTEEMKKKLLESKIDVEVMPRLSDKEHMVINASSIRAAYQKGDWDYIRERVPETTYTYLKEKCRCIK